MQSLTHSILSAPSGAQGGNKGSPSVSIGCCSGCSLHGQASGLQLFVHRSAPGLFWSASVSLALRSPSKCCFGDGIGGHSANVAKPPPAPGFDGFGDGGHVCPF